MSSPSRAERLPLPILKLFVPGHLNRFEFGFVGRRRITGKTS
jgi:hypothetical protein